MVDFQLDEMQEMLRELAHEFARDEIRPNAEHWDEESIYPKETIQLAHEMGLLNLHIPEAYGGPGLGCMEEVLVNEELAWGDPGFATAAYATALACAPIITGATEEQKNIWFSDCIRGESALFCNLTQPDVLLFLSRSSNDWSASKGGRIGCSCKSRISPCKFFIDENFFHAS